MKPINKLLMLTIIFGILFFPISAQDTYIAEQKYRVTAVNKQDQSVVSQSNVAEIIPRLSLYIPNAFSPNGDGLNDQFGPVGEGIEEFHMTIYDRWGNVIFVSDDVNHKWDGISREQEVETGVFVYHIIARNSNREAVTKTGSVSVVP